MAAGGIVIRNGAKPLVAVVQRRRDNAWVLPKGKLKPNEKPIAGARREAVEETGSSVRVYEYLGVISYVGGSGPKIAHFWRMQAIGAPLGKPSDDIKAVEWLPLSAAIERLNLGARAILPAQRRPQGAEKIAQESPQQASVGGSRVGRRRRRSCDQGEGAGTSRQDVADHAAKHDGTASYQAREAATALARSSAADQTVAICSRADGLTAKAGGRAAAL